ncbi:MAG: von Willebrand factor type A domain-containing protein, partial [Phycisphaeraceae bacterium]|nr:von Willebrand factor type A domain-containing protein [Phycisphaeraceae bacterium]
MSDPTLTPPDDQTPDEQAREFGRQLAADSILKAAMQLPDTPAETEPVRGSSSSSAPRPRTFPWWKVGSLAAGLLVTGVTVVLVMNTWMGDYASENTDPVKSLQRYDSSRPNGASQKSYEPHREYLKENPGRQPGPRPRQIEPPQRPAPGPDNSGSFRTAPQPPRWEEPHRQPPRRPVAQNFRNAQHHPLSTFSTDVDTAAYTLVRRSILRQRRLPSPDQIRIEEMVNYFRYHDPAPHGDEPMAVKVEVASAPWQPAHRLVRIGLKAREVQTHRRPQANLVFLIDVSGSMRPADKLPLLKRGLRRLVHQLDGDDRIAIVTYAGAAGLALPSTPAAQSNRILGALESLHAGGSTNGGRGIQLAYRVAQENFIRGGINRVLLASDGDFNVGLTRREDLHRLIAQKRQSGVFLSVLGFGTGNYRDRNMETLADKGNGHYHYIDSDRQAYRVLVEQVSSTLVTVAKDVKIQVEFNPQRVRSYRLIGYENRRLAVRDFNDDFKDAGEMGADHTVTALYEVVPTNVEPPGTTYRNPAIDPLRYGKTAHVVLRPAPTHPSDELLLVKWRYKRPDGHRSQRRSVTVIDRGHGFESASDDFRFAASVAAFGKLLRGDGPTMTIGYRHVAAMAENAMGRGGDGDR